MRHCKLKKRNLNHKKKERNLNPLKLNVGGYSDVLLELQLNVVFVDACPTTTLSI
jgi:hypothetical protein